MQIAEKITKKERELKMPEKDPSNYTYITYLWVLLLSFWGGAVSFISKVKSGVTRRFNFLELTGEIFISGFSGICTFLLCEWANIAPLLTAFLVAISGHMGTRIIFKAENVIDKWIDHKFPFLKNNPTEKGDQ